MKKNKVYTVLRVIFGLALLFFGISGLFQLMPPPEMTGAAADTMAGLMASGYIMPIVQIAMIVVGLAFLANRYIALASIVFFPLSLNFVLFHIFLDMATIIPSLVIFVINIYFISQHSKAIRPLFKA